MKHFQLRFDRRAAFLLSEFHRLAANPEADRFKKWRLQEGLISSAWQAWSGFCRSTLLASAAGTTSASGKAVSSSFAAYTEPELCFIALQFARKHRLSKIASVRGMYEEPTWGDFSKAGLIANGFASTNVKQLTSSLGAASLSLDLQHVRNACAHISRDGIGNIKGMRVRYGSTTFIHPSDTVFWIDRATNDWAFKAWIYELQSIANKACL